MLVMLSLSFGPIQRSQEVFLNMDRQNKPLKSIYSSVVSTRVGRCLEWHIILSKHHWYTIVVYFLLREGEVTHGGVNWREERNIKRTHWLYQKYDLVHNVTLLIMLKKLQNHCWKQNIVRPSYFVSSPGCRRIFKLVGLFPLSIKIRIY